MANQHALIQPSLARFDKNKEKLLQRLIDGRNQGARTVFDAEASWTVLRRAAEFYLSGEQMRKSAPSNAQTANDLAKIKQNLNAVHVLLGKNDVAVELMKASFRARHKQQPKNVLKADPFAASKILNELNEAASHIRKLEMTSSGAATKARSKPGRPNSGSTILPSDYIVGLAKVYRDATGRVPGAGEGPFGFFLVDFLDAIGRRNSVFNLIIRARKKSLTADANSPFKRKTTH
jgi:hypothetical protein